MNDNYIPDQTNLEIMKHLQANVRMSHRELGHWVNKSISSIHARVKRLEDLGYITRYTAILDPKKISRGLTGYIEVILEKHTEACLGVFMKEVVKLDEVMECYHLTGAYDFLLRVAIKDMNEYSNVLMKKLSNLPGIENFTSLFVMSEVKQETAYKMCK